ncbi:AAA family ATPase [Nitrospira sp. M1]
MYLAFYGLRKEAFQITPDPSFLYMSSSHKEALGAIVYGIKKRKGFVEITGEVGVGKTTIIRAFLEEHSDPKQKTVYIFNPVLSYHGLLTTIFTSLDLVATHNDESGMINQLHEALIEEYKAGGTVILIIDEAQNMPIETLENLRMLSNLETATEKLIQIVLVGQPELETLLQQPALRQFQQRIALRAKISPLTEKESKAFILHRIAVASTPRNPVFSNKALQLIARKGRGIPRRLNVLCDNALITGFGRQLTPVPVSVVKEVLSDLDGSHPPVLWKWALATGFVLIVGIGMIAFWESRSFHENTGMEHNVSQEKQGSLNTSKDPTVMHTQQAEPSSAAPRPDGDPMEASRSQVVLEDVQGTETNPETETAGNMQSVKNVLTNRSMRPSIVSRQNAATSSPAHLPAIHVVDPVEHSHDMRTNMNAQSTLNSPLNEGDEQPLHLMKTSSSSKQLDEKLSAVHAATRSRVVELGESLSQITHETYGSTKREYIEWVKQHNPHIMNPNMILPGQYLVLPEYQQGAVSP